jgi:hypothetical protein
MIERIVQQVSDELVKYGYERKAESLFVKQHSSEIQAFLYLNIIEDANRAVSVFPIIGILYLDIEVAICELSGWEFEYSDDPSPHYGTYQIGLGYIMPQKNYLGYDFHDQQKEKQVIRELVETFTQYDEDFMRAFSDIGYLLKTLLEKDSPDVCDLPQRRIPIIHHKMGQLDTARKYVEMRMAQFAKKSTIAGLSYMKFGERFLNQLSC